MAILQYYSNMIKYHIDQNRLNIMNFYNNPCSILQYNDLIHHNYHTIQAHVITT
jgi:hypothetical protein